MKYIVVAIIAFVIGWLTFGVVKAASAQAVSAPYIEVETDLDGAVDMTLGGWTGGDGLEAYVEGTWVGSPEGTDWELELGTTVDLSFVETTLAGKYVWGETNGKDLLGLGDGREWGDIYAYVGGEIKPGLIGGEYLFAETDLLITSPVDIDYTKVDMGVGYNLELGDRAYVNGRMIWTADRDWSVNQSGVGVKVGFKF